MHISNVRMGFATNSSSSHSIVVASTATPTDETGPHFGWADFCLKSKESKTAYLAANLYSNLSHMGYSDDTAYLVVKGLFPSLFTEDDVPSLMGVDHQSVITLPIKRNLYTQDKTLSIDFNFVKDLHDYILNNKDVAICGGNDNYDRQDYGGEEILNEIPRESCGDLWCRKDGEWWVLFNHKTGAKIRLSFSDNPAPYIKSTYPELVDIKITDFCPYGCEFCYQGSTIKGEHATLNSLRDIAYSLNRRKVFEVALGGGETTMHPQFAEILQLFSDMGIVVNFTTFSFKGWAKNPLILEAVKKYVGAIALSVSDVYKDYDKIKYAQEVCKEHNIKLHLQGVLGLLDTYGIISILDKMKDNRWQTPTLTLLGYKKYGRGIDLLNTVKLKKVDMGSIIAAAKERHVNLGLDTLAVQQYKDVLVDNKIPESLTTKTEGSFSMYIDAVKQFIAQDSYSDKHISYVNKHLSEVLDANYPFN